MSDLYTTPSEARRENNSIGKTGNFWQDWYTDRVRGGINYNESTGEYDKTGMAFWGGMLGMNNEKAITAIEDGKDKVRDSKKIEQTLAQYPGVTDEQLLEASNNKKITGKNVKGVVTQALRTIKDTPSKVEAAAIKQGENADALARQQLAATLTQMSNTEKRLDYQFEVAQMKDARDRAERLDDKAENRRDRLDLLDRQDHRYAQEMQRYDKRRRQETIQGLVGGLASLGAAFAM